MGLESHPESAESTDATQLRRVEDPALEVTADSPRARPGDEAFVRGASFGRYVVLDRLGAGNMGVVYGAYDPELDRKVALKLLKFGGGDVFDRARLLREAQAMARLAHPNVVTVHDVGTFGEEIFVAMEFVQGVTLRRWLDEAPRTWREVVEVFIAVARGLSAAHDAGLIHRDLKPDNIMIGADGRVRVMDFGLARASAMAPDGPGLTAPSGASVSALTFELTRAGTRVGTPAYMAPEQWSEAAIDARTDQFAYCVALWDALYDERPFQGPSLAALMLAVTQGQITPPSEPRRAPAWLRQVVSRGLAPEPGARWASMDALRRELVRDRLARLRRWLAVSVATATLVAGGFAAQQVLAERAAAANERDRADAAESGARAADERADREAFERAALADAARSAEVLRLATTPGHERDALVLGIEVLAPFGPGFAQAPGAAVDGLARGLSAMLPIATLSSPERPAFGVAFAPDSSLLAVNHWGANGIKIWSTQRLAVQHLLPDALPPAENNHGFMIFSPDSRRLAVSSEARCIIWDLAQEPGSAPGSAPRSLELLGCSSPFFSPDAKTLYGKVPRAQSEYGARPVQALAAWDASSAALRWSRPMPGKNFLALAHPDGQRLLVLPEPQLADTLEVLSAASGATLSSLRAAPDRRRDATVGGWFTHRGDFALSPDGRHVVDHYLHLWDLDMRTVRQLGVLEHDAPRRVAFSADGRRVLVHGSGLDVYALDSRTRTLALPGTWSAAALPTLDLGTDGRSLWDLSTGVAFQELPPGKLHELESSPDGRFMATVTHAEAKLWSTRDFLGAEPWQGRPPHASIVAFDGEEVVTRDTHSNMYVHDRRGERPSIFLDDERSNDSRFGSAWSVDTGIWRQILNDEDAEHNSVPVNKLRFHDKNTGSELFAHDAIENGVGLYLHVAAPSRRTSLLAAANHDGGLDVFDAATSRRVCALPGDGSDLLMVAISDHADWVAALRRSGELAVWSVPTCTQTVSLWPFPRLELAEDHYPPITTFEFSEHGDLTIRHEDFTLVVDASGSERLRVDDQCRRGHSGYSLLSPDGRYLLTSCALHESLHVGSEGHDDAWLWDVDAASLVAELDLREYTSHKAQFARTGEFFALVSGQGHLAIFATSDGEELLRVRGRTRLRAFKLRDDGELADAVDEDGMLRTYPTTKAGLVAAACRALTSPALEPVVAAACAPHLR